MTRVAVGRGLNADVDVVLGYVSTRSTSEKLRIGSDARLRSGTVLYLGSTIGDGFETGHHVVVREDNLIGDRVSVWSNSVVDYGCVVGDRVKIHSNCYVAQFTELGDGVFLAPGVTITNDLYPGVPGSAERMRGPRIDAGTQIGANATILPYVHIGAGALIGAGAVVTRDIPGGILAYGSPAVAVRPVEELEDEVAIVGRSGREWEEAS